MQVTVSISVVDTNDAADVDLVPGEFITIGGESLLSGGMITADIDCGDGKTCSLTDVSYLYYLLKC